jgi:hypothetical protein
LKLIEDREKKRNRRIKIGRKGIKIYGQFKEFMPKSKKINPLQLSGFIFGGFLILSN